MFSHLIKYAAKIFFQNREGVAFGILFPLAFGLIYLFAFQGLFEADEAFEPVPVAMVAEEGEGTDLFKEGLANIATPVDLVDGEFVTENSDENVHFLYYDTDESEANRLVDEGMVGQVLYVEPDGQEYQLSLLVAPDAANDISSTIVYTALSSFSSINLTISELYSDAAESPNPPAAIEAVNQHVAKFNQTESILVDSNQEVGVSSFSIFYYACLAYICIFFMQMGIAIVTENEADYSHPALLVTASPIPKSKRFLANFVVSLVSCLAIVYVLLYIYHRNDIPLGNDTGRLVALMTLGVIVGMLLGTAIASLLKAKEDVLTGIAVALPLVLGAFSGLMNLDLKFYLMEVAPWLAKVNPVSLINDAIYYLNNYPTYTQYNQNMMILSLYAVICLAITIIALRRTDYENL